MDSAQLGIDYLHLRTERLDEIVRRRRITRKEAELFLALEDRMNSNAYGEDWLQSFHLSNDDYMRLLQKVLAGLVRVGEPHAEEKQQAFIEEKGSMSPAVFLTPWDVTLATLDEEIGAFDEVREFYSDVDDD